MTNLNKWLIKDEINKRLNHFITIHISNKFQDNFRIKIIHISIKTKIKSKILVMIQSSIKIKDKSRIKITFNISNKFK